MCTCVSRPEVGVFLICSMLFFETRSLTQPDRLAGPAGGQVAGIHLSPPPHARSTGLCLHDWLSTCMRAGNLSAGLLLA